MLILNKSKVWNIHAGLSKVFLFYSHLFPSSFFLTLFFINYHAQEVFFFLFLLQGEEQPSGRIILTRRHGPITPALRQALMWRKGGEIGGKSHSYITVMIWFNPAAKLYVACLKKMLTLITEVRGRGAGWDCESWLADVKAVWGNLLV